MLVGVLGFLIFPWYVTGDGFFSINWILEYSLEDYGSVLPQVFINKKYWLLPLIVPLSSLLRKTRHLLHTMEILGNPILR